jgi:alkaline phosphatase
MRCSLTLGTLLLAVAMTGCGLAQPARADHLRELQSEAVRTKQASWGHWGPEPDRYASWGQHTNRLIPLYTFGMTLDKVRLAPNPYHDPARLTRLYGQLPEATVNPSAQYLDQTVVHALQRQAVDADKKYIILVVFDGMDWHTTWAAAIQASGEVGYREGRGTGLAFLDYRGADTDYGFFVTAPHNDGARPDVDQQKLEESGGRMGGGYDPELGGATPWAQPADPEYLIGRSVSRPHAYTDSASSATSLTSGIKTYNKSINIDAAGNQVEPIARVLQREGFAIGVVTSVPISHATPGCAYANNVTRYDYQDISRDLLGLPSVSHPREPLPGVDVLIGAGWGSTADKDARQGENYKPGGSFLADEDLRRVSLEQGGAYRVVQRTAGKRGKDLLDAAVREAVKGKQRLLGYFGLDSPFFGSHLPFQTADGGYDPTRGSRSPAETYSPEDIQENPTLADMTQAALTVLEHRDQPFWLMVEAGDVDWANHDNNLDNSIGAVKSGDEAFRTIVRWVEDHEAWDDTAVILTADHGHYLVLDEPEALLAPPEDEQQPAGR